MSMEEWPIKQDTLTHLSLESEPVIKRLLENLGKTKLEKAIGIKR